MDRAPVAQAVEGQDAWALPGGSVILDKHRILCTGHDLVESDRIGVELIGAVSRDANLASGGECPYEVERAAHPDR